MSAFDLLDLILGVGILGTAAVALTIKDRVLTVMMFLGLGVLLAVLWARLNAPDLAIAEAAIASGVTGALLISAIGALRSPAEPSPGPERPTSGPRPVVALVAVVVAVVAVAGLLAWALISATRVGSPGSAGDQATQALPQAVVEHPITVVLLQFRSYDTLLEVLVLAAAAVVVLSLPADEALRPLGVRQNRGELFEGFARVVAPIVVLLAGWLLVAGSTRPGGAFQAGALVTGLLLLAHLSGRMPLDSPLLRRWLLPSIALGPASFLALAVLTAGFGEGWLVIADPWGGTVVVVLEAALAISIGAALATAFLAGRGPLPLVADTPRRREQVGR